MQKIKADQAQERKNIVFTTKYMKHPSLVLRSPIPVVTLHAAPENGSSVPAG